MRYIKKQTIKKQPSVEKKEVIKRFSLTATQSKKIDKYVFELLEFNKHTNLIGKSTLKIYGKDISQTLFSCLFLLRKKHKNF